MGKIRTTVIGSLQRPDWLLAAQKDPEFPPDLLRELSNIAIRRVIRDQVDIGLDEISNGELTRRGYVHYVQKRLKGFSDKEFVSLPVPTELPVEMPPIEPSLFRFPKLVSKPEYIGEEDALKEYNFSKEVLKEVEKERGAPLDVTIKVPAASPGGISVLLSG